MAVMGMATASGKLLVAELFFATLRTKGPAMGKELPLPICPGLAEPPVIWMGILEAPAARVRLLGVVPPVPVPSERHT